MEVHDDGREIVYDKKGVASEATVRSRFQITIWGDYIRFADAHGTDVVRAEFPWLAPEDPAELARRIGQLVDSSLHPGQSGRIARAQGKIDTPRTGAHIVRMLKSWRLGTVFGFPVEINPSS